MNSSEMALNIVKHAKQTIKHTDYGTYGVQPVQKKAKLPEQVQTNLPGPKYDSEYVGYSMKYAEDSIKARKLLEADDAV